MLDEIVNLIKNAAGQAVQAHPDVPNEQAGAVAEEASHSILGDLENGLKGGGISDILGMLTGKKTDIAGNNTTQQMTGNLTSKLTEKLGISPSAASSLGASIIPAVLSKLTNKVNDPNDSSLDLQGVVNQLTGGKTAGIDLKSILDRNGDGEINLGDAMSLFAGDNNSSTEQSGGGILGKLKGMFGG
jgi:uncharacterized protein YidB (DUF937 family)